MQPEKEIKRPKVGVGVIVRKEGKVLLGKRKNSHGCGDWSFPGGHLEFNEFPFDCAKREVLEETGLHIHCFKEATFTNDIFTLEDKHYITLFVVADWIYGEVELLEPEKCEKWEWFVWDKLPNPLFLPIKNLLKQDFNPFDV